MLDKLISRLKNKSNANDMQFMLDALDQSQAIIQFTTDGKIITAKQNFFDTLGYSLNETIGRHNRVFLEPE